MLRILILVAVVVGLALWLLKGRKPLERKADEARRSGKEPASMVACAHCGVHLPRPDAVLDSQGRVFCGEAHRVAGPR
jgi:uncharacterized protein